mmetsp:Transcript_38311/g.82380  ORF Transcript_38311/g.82380 Transcript_38311/m.82380 type:complete len:226 (+) Transcript_38311:16-693(+)
MTKLTHKFGLERGKVLSLPPCSHPLLPFSPLASVDELEAGVEEGRCDDGSDRHGDDPAPDDLAEHAPLDVLGPVLVHADADDGADLAVGGGDRHPRAGGEHHAEGGAQLYGKSRGKVDGREVLADGFDDMVAGNGEAEHDAHPAQQQDVHRGADVARILAKVEPLHCGERASGIGHIVRPVGKALERRREDLQIHEDTLGLGSFRGRLAQQRHLLALVPLNEGGS